MCLNEVMLILTSPNLYLQSKDLTRKHFSNVPILVWEQGDVEERKFISNELMSKKWMICASIYNDYIFSEDELKNIPTVINIHPALPHIRGRGYDLMPLMYKQSLHGVTLHFVNKFVDAGPIIDVLIEPIPDGICYHDFRRRNQFLSLQMLDRFFNLCHQSSIPQLIEKMNILAGNSTHSWSGDFMNTRNLQTLLINFFKSNPNHPLLDQIPQHLITK
jgi:methionyl-tRNA formyltransferase